jgi:RNA polymerase sigma-70 factor (ECF subfamily)
VPTTRSRSRRRGEDGDAELERWIEAARAGDTDAFGWIWQRHSPRVHGYLRGRGVTSAEDVTSEVFLAAFTGLGRFTGTAPDFRSWLFTIAHHKAVDDHRHRRDDAEYDPADDPRTMTSAEADALDGIVDADVRAMLAALTSDQREVLLLRSLGDLSLEQVARMTGRTVGAVKQLYHRAVASSQRAVAVGGTHPGRVRGSAESTEPTQGHFSGAASSAPVTRTAFTAMTEL